MVDSSCRRYEKLNYSMFLAHYYELKILGSEETYGSYFARHLLRDEGSESYKNCQRQRDVIALLFCYSVLNTENLDRLNLKVNDFDAYLKALQDNGVPYLLKP